MIARLPDWGGGLTETLSWATSVDVPRDGVAEERRCLRPAPERRIRAGMWLSSEIDQLLMDVYEDTHTLGYLPGATLTPTTGAGVTEIDLSRAPYLYGFEPDRGVVVMSPDGSVQTTEVTAMVIAAGLEQLFVDPAVDLAQGDVIMPGLNARLGPSLNISWSSARVRTSQAEWLVTDSARWPQTGLTDDEFDLDSLYDDVESFAPESGAAPVEVFWRLSTQQEGMSRRVEEFGGISGARNSYAVDALTRSLITQAHEVIGRQEAWGFRRMLYRRRGRFSPCFVPAGQALDFLGTREWESTQWLAFTDVGWRDANDARRALVLHMRDGTRQYHTFASMADADHLTIDVPAGEMWAVNPFPAVSAIDADDVVGADWLVYARLSSDVVALQWSSPEHLSVNLGWWALQWPSEWEAAP